MRGVQRTRGRLAAATLGVAAVTTGCATSQVYWIGASYYSAGPEAVIASLEAIPIPPEDVCLAGMELAMARLELGRYESVAAALEGCDRPPADLDPDRRYYGGEPHEKVWRDLKNALNRGIAMAADHFRKGRVRFGNFTGAHQFASQRIHRRRACPSLHIDEPQF